KCWFYQTRVTLKLTLNFSQSTVSYTSISYETKMKDGTWNWNKFSDDHEAVSALKVADIDGQLVTLDGRRLLVIQKLR
ncbi:unnamed protein product, partial [Didymodactylos carnosus]